MKQGIQKTQKNTVFFAHSKLLPSVEMRQAQHSNACYQTHSHDEFSFGVIDAGLSTYRNRKQAHQIGKGTLVTINPGDAHSCNPATNEWSYRMLFVDTQWIATLQEEQCQNKGADYQPFATTHYANNHHHYQHFDQLYKSLLQGNNHLEAETRLIDFLQRCFTHPSAVPNNPQAPDNFHIGRVQTLLMDQLDKHFSLSELSQEAGLSRFHLIRSFKKYYGQPPHAYQLDQRIKKARQLLQQGIKLAEVAQRLGFADQSHFQRNFKKRVAVTPKQYQAFFY